MVTKIQETEETQEKQEKIVIKPVKTPPKEQHKGAILKGDMVEVPKEEWDEMKKMFDQMRETNAMLLEVADRKRLDTYYVNHQKKRPAIMHLSMILNKIVIGWTAWKDDGKGNLTAMDRVYQNPLTGVWLEEQKAIYYFEDGSSAEMFQKQFNLGRKLMPCEKISQSTDEHGNVTFKLKRKDNAKEYEVSDAFVN